MLLVAKCRANLISRFPLPEYANVWKWSEPKEQRLGCCETPAQDEPAGIDTDTGPAYLICKTLKPMYTRCVLSRKREALRPVFQQVHTNQDHIERPLPQDCRGIDEL